MVDTRRRARDTTDDELEPPVRVVTPRRSNTPEPTEPTERVEETEPSEDSDPNEEPFEDEEEPHPTLSIPQPVVSPTIHSSPIVPSSPIPNSTILTSISQCRANSRQWDWMPGVLERWREREQIPILPEVPGPDTPIPTLTREPVHHTIPVLITRLVSHEERLDQLDHERNDRINLPASEVQQLEHDVFEAKTDITQLQESVSVIQDDITEYREEVEALHQRARSAEDRAEAAENRAERLEGRVNAMEQEIIALRADRDQLRTAIVYSTRLVDRLEGLCERLR